MAEISVRDLNETESLADGENDRPNLGQVIRERFAELGGVELGIPDRRDVPRAADPPE